MMLRPVDLACRQYLNSELLFDYRTENLCSSCGWFQRLTYRLARRDRGHEEAWRDRDGVLEAACEQTQAQPKEAEVTAIPPMQPLQPVVAQRTDAEVDQPQIRQTCGDQQACQALGLPEMALMQVEAATLLVRKERLDMCSFPIRRQCRFQVQHVRDQVERLLVGGLPDRQDADRAILRCRHPRRPYRQHLPTRRGHRPNGKLLSVHGHQQVGAVRHT